MKPLVSIIIPTYNRVHLIGETLDSVIAQTYQNWECIVVDDGSTDATDKLMEFYCEKDSRIQYHHRPINRPKGANACRNYGFELSKGKFLQWLDSDDLISDDKIKFQVEILSKNIEIDISFCRCVFFENNLSQFSPFGGEEYFSNCKTPKNLFDHFGHTRTYLPPHAYLMKREHLEKSGGWNEYLKINQDGEFFSRVLLTANKICYSINGKVFYRRRSTNNTSLYDSLEKVEDSILSWKLIEKQHRVRYKHDNLPYIENAKETIFPVINKNFPELVVRNREFFKQQLRRKSIFYRVLKKLMKR